uniref:Myotubularin phosphatase domain-containing protein n=1 Tax=Mesocestoides corti TaxID=53468 RepID=A0A5K3F8X1_MESCO
FLSTEFVQTILVKPTSSFATELDRPIIGAQECKLWFVWARPFSAWKVVYSLC